MRISSTLLRRFRSQEGFWSKRNLPHPDACGIENSIANGGCNDRDRGLSGAGDRRVQIINQDRNDFGNCVAELQNRVAPPVFGSDATRCPVELDLFVQRSADALDHLTFYLVGETIWINDGARVHAGGD